MVEDGASHRRPWWGRSRRAPVTAEYVRVASGILSLIVPFVGLRVLRPLRIPTAEEARKYEPDPKIFKEYFKAMGGAP